MYDNFILRKNQNQSIFNRLNIETRFNNNNYLNEKEGEKDNFVLGNSNYSTLTYRQPKLNLLNKLSEKENKNEFQTDLRNTPPITSMYNTNTVNVRNIQKYNLYLNNNTPKIDNIKYSYYSNNDNKPPTLYSTKTNNPDIQDFNPYVTNNIPKIIKKRSNTSNTAIPKSLKFQQTNNNNSYNNYQSSENTNYLNKENIIPEKKNNQLVNNTKTFNNIQLINNAEPKDTIRIPNNQIYNNQNEKSNITFRNQFINSNPQYINNKPDINNEYIYNNIKIKNIEETKNKDEINNAFLNNNRQLEINQRVNINPQFSVSARLPSTNLQLNNIPISNKNNFQIDANNQMENDELRNSLPQKVNPQFNIFRNQNINNFAELTKMNKTNPNINPNIKKESENFTLKKPEETEKIINKQVTQVFQPKFGEIISDNNVKEYYIQSNGRLVKSYGYSEEQNPLFRNYMEDEGKSIENLGGDPNKILFCLFDGHGGGQVSSFLQDNFHIYFKELFPFTDFIKGILNLFKLLDEKIKELNLPYTGSTGTIVLIERQNEKKILYCANVGDTRCVLVNKKRILRMSYDDRVEDPKEINRIIKQGGIVFDGRINGQLMLSRTFGDWALKSLGAIVNPHISKIEINEDDLFLIIASDGVWDVINDEDCRYLCNTNKNSLEISKNIIVESLNRGAQDNISCFVISFQ